MSMIAIAQAGGLTPLSPATTFVAIEWGGDGVAARAVLAVLAARDVFVHMLGTAPIDQCIEVVVGSDATPDLFAVALPEALAEERTVAA